ncbi:MAG: twin-arginine translocation signal domain-containing protein [Pseudolabrys sp.]
MSAFGGKADISQGFDYSPKIKLDSARPFRPELVARGEVEIAVPQPSSRITLSLLPANPENLYHSHQFWIHAESSKEHTMTRKNLGPRVDRRKFLKGVAVAGAAGTVNP